MTIYIDPSWGLTLLWVLFGVFLGAFGVLAWISNWFWR